MMLWIIRHYVSAAGTNKIEAHYDGQSPSVQAAFDNAVRFLAQRPPNDWREPYAKKLKGDCDGLVEIKFKADGVQQRPLGFYGPGRMEFTILFWAIEKGGKFVPKGACKLALGRKNGVKTDPQTYSTICDVE